MTKSMHWSSQKKYDREANEWKKQQQQNERAHWERDRVAIKHKFNKLIVL